MSSISFLAEYAAPVLAAGFAMVARPFVNWLSLRSLLLRRRKVRVTLPGGKTEYLSSRSVATGELSDSLTEYLAYEKTVQEALKTIPHIKTEIRDIPNKADFKIHFNGRSCLVEAKTHLERVNGRELKILMDEDDSNLLIMVTPSSLTKSREARLRNQSGGRIEFLSGRDVDTLKKQFDRIFTDK